MHPKTLAKLKEHSIAVFTFDPNGVLLIDPRRHPAGEAAPSKLLVFVEESLDGVEECLAEIGVVRQHPYRSLHNGGFNLSPRCLIRTMSEKQVSRVVPEICSVLDDLIRDRAGMEKRSGGLVRGWKSSIETQWYDKFPRGVGFSVAERDSALLRLFDELESINPALYYGIRRIAWHINLLPRGRKYRGHYSKYWSLEERFRRDDWMPLTRPHIMGAIGRHLRRAIEFLEFFTEVELLSPRGFQQAVDLLRYPSEPILEFTILPQEATRWDVLGRRDGLPIRFIRKLSRGYALVATIRQSDWSLRAAAEGKRLEKRNIPGDRFPEPDFREWDIPDR